MRRSPLFLCLALAALAACSDNFPTSPTSYVPQATSPDVLNISGFLEVPADDASRYVIRLGNGEIIPLICDKASIDATMVGDLVLASGRFNPSGEFVVENLQRVTIIATDDSE
ncbi:MAG TPA: hypothetical protein VIF32_07550 [Gemmatimonadaceae bacterium]|jgi:hypothetical protein